LRFQVPSKSLEKILFHSTESKCELDADLDSKRFALLAR
jgi:hypothetical protein